MAKMVDELVKIKVLKLKGGDLHCSTRAKGILSKHLSYKSESLYIEYEDFNGKKRGYVPDILIEYFDGYQEIVEVKPFYCLKDKGTQLKLAAGLSYAFRNHMGFKIWTKKNWPGRDSISHRMGG